VRKWSEKKGAKKGVKKGAENGAEKRIGKGEVERKENGEGVIQEGREGRTGGYKKLQKWVVPL
jgi:hypothetical protein